jgi:F-type H+-transporting ATPase subunit epsilon|tara:strand:+ start:152 stop:547 length:396 start_codon:yes stop_codon:yes gene_type:complete
MTNKFDLTIISAESKVFEGKVENILVPGMVGDFLVLANHAPCISSIRPGFLEFSEGTSDKQKYFVSGGIIEVINNMVSVLVDSAVSGEKIVKEDITNLISEVDERLSAADTINKDDLGLRKNDLEEALKQA